MDQQELVAILQQHGIDTRSLLPLTASGPDSTYRLSIDGAGALAYWQTLRAIVEETGFWPVLLGGDEDAEEFEDELRDARDLTPEGAIEAGARLDVQAWVRRRLAELGRGPERGPWPDDVGPAETFTIPYDMQTWEPLPRVHVALVPTRQGWQVPAFLRYGGWNECPNPEEHVGMLKHWAEAYGAEPIGMARDRVEMKVSRPPTRQDRALDLAREQYAYCSDIVDQGTETLDALAAGLLKGIAWYFWWD